ncbi:MAG: SDR family oxidoreductase [Bacteroidota bacterium]
MKNILVTGGTGFIGSNLTQKLLAEGYNVTIFRRETSNLSGINGIDVEHRIGDVRDKESIRKAMEGCDTVFHTAATVSFWRKKRDLIYEVNVIGTRNVAEAALEVGVERLVYTSSVAAFGYRTDGKPTDETTEFNWGPLNIPYKNSKYEAEQEILKAVQKGLHAVIVNPTVVIGARDLHFHGGQLIRDVKRGLAPLYLDSWINVVYVGDVVFGHIQAAKKGRVGERYILCGENLKTKDAFERTAKIVGGLRPKIRVPFLFAKAAARICDLIAAVTNTKPLLTPELIAAAQYENSYTAEKAMRELDYRITPFEVAVREAYEWYVEHGMI